jgi:light-regulated signal transduction histidine kinase (bacteriophytochrome)
MMEKELSLALTELAFQSGEREKHAIELVAANKELAFQNEEKEKRAAELTIANTELTYQNSEKDKRAAELVVANNELAFQNEEKGKRAAELIVANKELAFQNEEKEKRAAELVIANVELAFQNAEKEKRAAELAVAYKELELFNFISSHDLQEPLRKMQMFVSRIMAEEAENMTEKGREYLHRIKASAHHTQALIMDLLAFSQLGAKERRFEQHSIDKVVAEVIEKLKTNIEEKQAVIEVNSAGEIWMIPFQFRQLFQNFISNSLKFSNPSIAPHILIESRDANPEEVEHNKLSSNKKYCHISISDNGIGFDKQYSEKVFELFQRLHRKDEYPGTGIGLAIVKRIIDNHKGIITVTSELNKGTTFDIFIPAE